jgi:phage terminase large subunit GpA-like protein
MKEVESISVYANAFRLGLKPNEILTVSEWADKYRVLSEVASAEPGPWRTSRVPYLKELMDVLSSHDPTQEIVFMKSAQVGGTEAGNCWLAYIIDYNPGPTMMVMPTLEMAKRNSKQRIAPLIESSPRLQEKVKSSKSRDSGNTVLQKEFPGGLLIMAGANSPVGLRSTPVAFLILDEVDAFGNTSEGDPIALATARQRTFSKKKKLLISTPVVESTSKIEPAYQMSDRRKYHVPCPHCGAYQHLKFPNLKFTKDGGNVVDAEYACEECGVLIGEHHKTDMLLAGKWIKENPNSSIAGFHINALYSPLGWFSWTEIGTEWFAAQKDPTKLQTFINTVLGESWKEKGDAPDWERLYERRTSRPLNVVPPKGLFLTCGCDVQKDRLELEIVAWGRNLQSWSVDYRVLMGDTSEQEVWDKLEEVINESWPVENYNIPMKLRATGIDSGYNTQMVYNFVRKQDQSKVFATKGQESLQQIISSPKKVEIKLNGKRLSKGVNLWSLGVSVAKSELYGFLRQAAPKESDERPVIGYCDFPEYGEEFFKMITAEEVFVHKIRGFDKRVWEKTRDRNEALDCRVMARAMASLVGIDRFKEKNWERLEKGRPIVNTSINIPKPVATKKAKIVRKKSDWL